MDIVGKQLRKIGRSLGLSDSEIARKVGLSETRYGNYVRNMREPDYATLLRICRVLNTTPNVLLGVSDLDTEIYRRQALEEKLVAACKSLDLETLGKVLKSVSGTTKKKRN